MEINHLDRISTASAAAAAVGATGPANTQASMEAVGQLVAAIHRLNRTEFLERGRELHLRRRGAGRPPMADLVDLETGEVLEELEPDDVLRMASEFERTL